MPKSGGRQSTSRNYRKRLYSRELTEVSMDDIDVERLARIAALQDLIASVRRDNLSTDAWAAAVRELLKLR